MSSIGFVGLGSAAADLGYGHRDIAAFFEVLGQMAASPAQHARDAA